MPLTAKGTKILKQMRNFYNSKSKADQVFYAMIKEKKLKGVESLKKPKKRKK